MQYGATIHSQGQVEKSGEHTVGSVMSFDHGKVEEPRFLSGWKEIATYLGKGVRTVQRYERELGLPVRRPAGKPRGSVVVTRAEIDAWVAANPIREAFRLVPHKIDSAPFTVAMKNRLQEMTRLREQMGALRDQVEMTVQLLRETLECVRGTMNGRPQRFSPASVSQTDDDLLRMAGRFNPPPRAS